MNSITETQFNSNISSFYDSLVSSTMCGQFEYLSDKHRADFIKYVKEAIKFAKEFGTKHDNFSDVLSEIPFFLWCGASEEMYETEADIKEHVISYLDVTITE